MHKRAWVETHGTDTSTVCEGSVFDFLRFEGKYKLHHLVEGRWLGSGVAHLATHTWQNPVCLQRRSTRILQQNLGNRTWDGSDSVSPRPGEPVVVWMVAETSSPHACGAPHSNGHGTNTQEESLQHG